VAEAAPTEAFMTAPSPGILTRFVVDTYYKDEDAYVDALAAAMRTEYRAVVDAGFILQIDCPDLGSCRHNQYRHLSDTEFRLIAQRIGRFADIVGREQVIAGSDCGLAPRRPHPRSSRPASSWPSSRRSLKARASLANGSGDRNGRSLSQQIVVTLLRTQSSVL